MLCAFVADMFASGWKGSDLDCAVWSASASTFFAESESAKTLSPNRQWAKDIVCKWDWTTVFSRPVSDKSHINCKELRAARLCLRRCAREGPRKAGRVILLLDSRVALGALVRGRSPSKVLNRQLKRVLPLVVAGDLYPQYAWIPSESNPSDPPSRGKALWRWLKQARKGDGATIDEPKRKQ